MKHKAFFIVALSVIIKILWSLDANVLLLMYDNYLTNTASIGSNDKRRIFSLDSTALEGKTVWITGSSSGIGAELAIQLSSAGVGHLILSGRRVDKLETVAKECHELHMKRANAIGKEATLNISLVPFDLAEPQVLDDAVNNALDTAPESGIDIIILNAGQYHCAPALKTDIDKVLPDLMQVNFLSPIQLAHKLIQKDRWRERKYGHIVAVSSLMGRGASALNAPYAATKHALRGYFQTLAAEEKSFLRVNVVLPGAVSTELWNASWNNKNDFVKALQADDRSKMSVHRCAQLIISSMISPSYLLFGESWISINPGLLWVYLASYAPCLFYVMTSIIAPLRLSMWNRDGEDALYLPTILQHMLESFVEHVRRWS